MNSIEVKGVGFSYTYEGSERTVLKDISLQCKRGEMVAILGSSGAGKSTLFHILGCLLRPHVGEVQIGGINTGTCDDEKLAWVRSQKIGFVFQQFFLNPRLSVLENITLPAKFASDPDPYIARRAEALATRLGIRSELRKSPAQLSGGQQQRVALARALVNDPEIILADEPTGALDPERANEIIDLFESLASQGRTVIIITHDSKVAARFPRIFRLDSGRLSIVADVQSGPSSSNPPAQPKAEYSEVKSKVGYWFRNLGPLIRSTVESMKQNRLRTTMAMLGVIIGVASVQSAVSLSRYLRDSTMASYSSIGSRVVRASVKKSQSLPRGVYLEQFSEFDWDRDFESHRENIPSIEFASPSLTLGSAFVTHGYNETDVSVWGVNDEYFDVLALKIKSGVPIHSIHLERKAPVCVLGGDIPGELWGADNPLGAYLFVRQEQSHFICEVIGVLERGFGRAFDRANKSIFLPYTVITEDFGYASDGAVDILVKFNNEKQVERINELAGYWNRRFGQTIVPKIYSEREILAQMDFVLATVALVTGTIAFLTLLGGGASVNNMIQMTVSERIREIGLAMALGASRSTVRVQILLESLLLCHVAGLIGALSGFIGFELFLFLGSKLSDRIHFSFIMDWGALGFSLFSMVLVGVFAGFRPAKRAQEIQVIDALRSV